MRQRSLATLAETIRWRRRRSKRAKLLMLATGFSGMIFLLSVLLSCSGCRFLFATPLLTVSLSAALLALAVIAQVGVDRLLYASALKLYLAPQVIDRIVSGDDDASLSASQRAVSVMVTDLEGFSGLMASLDPEVFAKVLNEYFSGILEVLWQYGAMIDKMTGDGVIALFGAPFVQKDHAERAVNCSREVARFSTDYIENMRRSGITFGRTRLGISSGTALVGNFGSHRHLNYTAYGEVVVIASRLESANKVLSTSTLMSEATFAALSNVEDVRLVGDLALKGVSQTVRAYSVG